MDKMHNNNENSIQKYRFIHHFLPSKSRKTRARLLTNQALVTYTLVQILFVSLIRIVPNFVPGVLGYASNINVSDLLRYTNEERAKVGLKPLSLNQNLSVAAERKASDMFKVGYWAHVSPQGTKPWDFILSQGYDYVYAGENLAKNFGNSKDVVRAWYDSPTHRDNLLSANYDDIGFAVVNGVMNGYETTVVVQMFGRARVVPQLAAVPPETVQPTKVPVVNEETLQGETPVTEETLIPTEEPVTEEIPLEESERTPLALNSPTESESVGNVEGDVTPILRQLVTADNITVADSGGVDPLIDVKSASRTITLTFGIFMLVLLAIDIVYSRKHGILKITGHTMAHVLFLVVILASVMLSIVPGNIL